MLHGACTHLKHTGNCSQKHYKNCYNVLLAQEEFEPWFISSRTSTEWFDVRYRGYGKNKIEQVRASRRASGVARTIHQRG